MKISKKEAGIIAVVIIALSGTSFAFAGNKETHNNGVPFKEIWDAIDGLQDNFVTFEYLDSRISEILVYILGLETNIDNLITLVLGLQTDIDEIELLPGPQGPAGPEGPPGFLGTPDYDSGFQEITADEQLTLTHNLHTHNLFVYVLGCDAGTENVHQRYLGGHIDWPSPFDSKHVGLCYWWKDQNNIYLHRYPDDNQNNGFDWDYYRVMIWEIG